MRSFLTCLALASCALPSLAQTVIYSEGFESGLNQWTATGLWHLESTTDACGTLHAPFPEGSRCAYYGIQGSCHYQTGVANNGTLTLNTPISIPSGSQRVSLHLWMLHDTESCVGVGSLYDRSMVQVSTNGGSTWTTVAERCLAKLQAPDFWNPRNIDLSSFQGQSILLRFAFDSVDDLDNNHFGVSVDRITIQSEAGSVFCTGLCPCDGPLNFNNTVNPQGSLSGCRNSARQDAELAGGGSASLSADSLVLNARELPPSAITLLVQGSSVQSGVFSGEGRACLGGSLVRIGVLSAVNGIASYPAPSASALSTFTGLPASGGTRHYQVQYRDVSNYCGSTDFNWSNGYSVVWAP